MLKIWEKLCSVLTSKTPGGAKHPRPAANTPQPLRCFQTGAEKGFPILQVLKSPLSFWEKSPEASHGKLSNQEGVRERRRSLSGQPREQGTHEAIGGWDGKFTFPHLELSPAGSGLLRTAPSAPSQLAPLQCVQTMQDLSGYREADSTARWVEMDRGKPVPLDNS